ncbi:MAG: ATP-binding protein, partial [Candidatus Kapabacteria bacterium]|nr:ATP-binding protein [Candidatus Kapabacteria bacterium]
MPLYLSAKPNLWPSAQMVFQHVAIEHGLPQNSVFAITQDHHGFLWFGTQDGLCRYDGYSVRVFRHNHKAPYSLRSNYIRSLLFDHKQHCLWVGTFGGGLNRYDYYTNRFTAFVHDTRHPHSIADNNILALYQDCVGKIWVGTEQGGLSLFDPATGTARNFVHTAQDTRSLPANRVSAITADVRNTLWIATLGGGLCFFKPHDSSFVRMYFDAPYEFAPRGILREWFYTTNDKEFAQAFPHAAMPENSYITALYADPEGILWVGTRGGGLLRVDVQQRQWERVLYTAAEVMIWNKRLTPAASNDVFSVCPDNKGNIWVGFDGRGVSVYHHYGGMTVSCVHDPYNPTSISDNMIRALYCDNAGTMWIGTSIGGVNQYAAGAQRFTTYRHEPLNPQSLSSDVVRAFAEDKDGTVWIGVIDGGLNRFIRSKGIFERHNYVPPGDTALGAEDVWALAAAKDGTLWIGTQNGLFAYHPRTRKRRVYRHRPQDSHSLSSNVIRCLHIDRDGTLWVGTNFGGLCRLNAESQTFRRLCFSVHNDSVVVGSDMPSDAIRAILHASDGTLWIGTVNLGVIVLDKQHNRIRAVYRHDENIPEYGLSNNTVRCFHEDTHGNIWVGTLDGLNCINPRTGVIQRFTESDGLPNDVIYGILEDAAGFLWLTTNKGLVRFHVSTMACTLYTRQDGLQHNEFNGNAVLHGSDGGLYVGGIGGYSMFYPDGIRDNQYIPPVVITNCAVFGKNIEFDTAISERTMIELPYMYSSFTLEFVALNFVGSSKNRYRYIMEGFDKQWVEAGTRREAVYTNVEPGEYIFRVQASNNDGVWNTRGAVLHIRVIPPWWGTWYFRLSIGLAVILGTLATYQARVYALRQSTRRLEQLVQMRTQSLQETNHKLEQAHEEIQRQMIAQQEQALELQRAYKQLDGINEMLVARNHELTHLNNEKNELLAIVSHDLRNPLVATLLAVKLLRQRFSELSQTEVFEYLAKIQSASEQMLDFIGKLLDINALEMGKVRVDIVPCNLDAITRTVLDAYQARVATKRITLHYQQNGVQPIVYADTVLLPQVLDNLLSNAVKYSPLGSDIIVRICKAESGALRWEVQDQGPGIAEQDKYKLFQKFVRLSARPTGGEHSTGLGLSIV